MARTSTGAEGLVKHLSQSIVAQAASRQECYNSLLGLDDICTVRMSIVVRILVHSHGAWHWCLDVSEFIVRKRIVVVKRSGFESATCDSLGLRTGMSFDQAHNILSVHGWTMDDGDMQLLRECKAAATKLKNTDEDVPTVATQIPVTFTATVPRSVMLDFMD
eukprot:TRINITY_DN27422_c0_g1_i1.p1 TRINITY_DN27422_c0_g1~~TRINITY_DN27422_c0_g1_i1.p1  ORF type:complete len:162 (-),score=19.88 TRINITY_DN27422_c0_g1_i1:389-874(-)